MKRYFKVWYLSALIYSKIAFQSGFSAVIFTTGKIIRFGIFILMLYFIASKTRLIAGYSFSEMVFFFLTFNLVDTVAQLFLREVYRVNRHINSGYFDYILSHPFSPLFRSLFCGSDIQDIPELIILIGFIIYFIFKLGIAFPFVVIYLVLVLNALLIAVAFHILVIGVGIIATEIGQAIMFYRDITQLGRFPVDIYKNPLRFFVTFFLPVGIMMTFPVKAMLGLLSGWVIILSFLIGGLSIFLALKFWSYSLKHYSSASS